jgi:N-acetylmuramoyl-L-alanine amidase
VHKTPPKLLQTQTLIKSIRLITVVSAILVFTSFSNVPKRIPPGSYKIKTIVIDAGHGGKDDGCHGQFAKEKDVALAIALKLGDYISKNFPDINVIYTRKTDTFIELYERADIANRNHADMFICIHCNANPDKSAYGTETYVMGLYKTQGNLDVAMRENNVVLMEKDYKQNYAGFDPNSPEGYIMLSLNQNAYMNQSIWVASQIESGFSQQGRFNRGVKQAGFLVLWRTTMPAFLCETGFLTNPTEEKYLASPQGQDQIAHNIFNAVRAYKNEAESDKGFAFTDKPDTSGSPVKSVPIILQVDSPPHVIPKIDTTSKPAQANKSAQDSIRYKVQFYSSLNSFNYQNYPAIKNITTEMMANGKTRYLSGNFTTLADALQAQTQIRVSGFKDAFVVEYKNGVRLPKIQ